MPALPALQVIYSIGRIRSMTSSSYEHIDMSSSASHHGLIYLHTSLIEQLHFTYFTQYDVYKAPTFCLCLVFRWPSSVNGICHRTLACSSPSCTHQRLHQNMLPAPHSIAIKNILLMRFSDSKCSKDKSSIEDIILHCLLHNRKESINFTPYIVLINCLCFERLLK